MPDEYQALENMVYATNAGFNARIGELQDGVDIEQQRVYYTVPEAIDNLREEFEIFKLTILSEVNMLVEKLRECAKANDIVDEQGGSLDEFLKNFKLHNTT
jgi:hypothetical protein